MGDTVMAAVVAPVLHKKVVPPEAVRVAGAPTQIMPSLAVIPDASVTAIAGTGNALTVKLVVAEGRQLGSIGVGVSMA